MKQEFVEILRCPLTGSALRLEAFESRAGEVEFGMLKGLGGDFPVVAGIPVFTKDHGEVAGLVRSGDHRIAVAAAAVADRYVNALDTMLKLHPLSNRLRRFTAPGDPRRKRAWLEWAAESLVPKSGSRPTARDLYDFAFLRCGSPRNESYHYNYCRFAMPGYFVGLSFLDVAGPRKGLLLDHSCGSGHLSWAMRRLCAPAGVVGCDVSYMSLFAARQAVEPEALYVCTDALQTPFRDGVFAMSFNSDALNNFSSKLAAFQEMARTTAPDGAVVLVWLRNSAHKHLYGKPVSTDAYRSVAASCRQRIYSDEFILRRFLGQADGAAPPAEEEVARQATFSMWASKGSDEAPDADRFRASAIPSDKLAVNPIYKTAGEGSYERQFPSTFFSQEDADKKYYYPERFSLTPAQATALRENRLDAELAPLLRTGAVVGRPERFA